MIELDLTNLNCPIPVLKTKKYLAQLESGSEVIILTTDPASIEDLSDFCKKSGNKLVSQYQDKQLIKTTIKRK